MVIKINEVNFEDNEVVKKYFSRIFTVLPKEIREKLMILDISETTLEKLKKELAFLPEDKQNEYLNEIHRIYDEVFNE
jgi:hypothetical protein